MDRSVCIAESWETCWVWEVWHILKIWTWRTRSKLVNGGDFGWNAFLVVLVALRWNCLSCMILCCLSLTFLSDTVYNINRHAFIFITLFTSYCYFRHLAHLLIHLLLLPYILSSSSFISDTVVCTYTIEFMHWSYHWVECTPCVFIVWHNSPRRLCLYLRTQSSLLHHLRYATLLSQG